MSARTAIEQITWSEQTSGALGLPMSRSSTGCTAIATHRPTGTHISVSHPARCPSWDELASARDAFAPGVRMVMHLPPADEYVNAHQTCLHLWEAP